jgi:arginase family enzyme
MGVRAAFNYFRTYSVELGFDFADRLKVADIGNVEINEWRRYDEAFAGIERIVGALTRANKVPLMLGGDHSVAYPAIRTFAEESPGRIGLIWIDNHYDAWEPFRGDPFHCGTPLRNLLTSVPDKLSGANVVHIGSRGFGNSAASARAAAELGVNIVPMGVIDRLGAVTVAEQAMEKAWDGTSAVYLTADLDAADVVYAPGTQSSRPGGLTAREMMTLVRECAVRGVGAFDVVECAPRADVSEVTAMLGAELVLEAIGGVAASRGKPA